MHFHSKETVLCWIFSSLITMASAFPAADPGPAPNSSSDYDEDYPGWIVYKGLDKNNDGVDMGDWNAFKAAFDNSFATKITDANKDGEISGEEFMAAYNRMASWFDGLKDGNRDMFPELGVDPASESDTHDFKRAFSTTDDKSRVTTKDWNDYVKVCHESFLLVKDPSKFENFREPARHYKEWFRHNLSLV